MCNKRGSEKALQPNYSGSVKIYVEKHAVAKRSTTNFLRAWHDVRAGGLKNDEKKKEFCKSQKKSHLSKELTRRRIFGNGGAVVVE